MGKGTQLCVGTDKLFSFIVFLFIKFSLQASHHPILSIMETLVTEPYSVTSHLLHKLSCRQPGMLLENRLLLVCNIHEENQHGCQRAPEFNYSAKPVLWGEDLSFVQVSELLPSELTVTSQTLWWTLYKDLFFILHMHGFFLVLDNCK